MKKSTNPILGIYKITNTINGKAYIGKSHDIFSRWVSHWRGACKFHFKGVSFRGIGAIHKAMHKYGVENFKFEILFTFPLPNDEVTDSMLSSFEIFFIADQNTYIDDGHGYNLTKGGEGNKPSKQTREKMSASNSGKRNGFYHKRHKLETIEANRLAHIGVNNHSPERIAQMKIVYSGQGNPFFHSTHDEQFLRNRSKPILCIETGEFYRSSGYAGFHTNQLAASIYQAARLGTKAGQFHWKFITWKEYDELACRYPLFDLPLTYLNSRKNIL
jgi:group I intron endonuclease